MTLQLSPVRPTVEVELPLVEHLPGVDGGPADDQFQGPFGYGRPADVVQAGLEVLGAAVGHGDSLPDMSGYSTALSPAGERRVAGGAGPGAGPGCGSRCGSGCGAGCGIRVEGRGAGPGASAGPGAGRGCGLLVGLSGPVAVRRRVTAPGGYATTEPAGSPVGDRQRSPFVLQIGPFLPVLLVSCCTTPSSRARGAIGNAKRARFATGIKSPGQAVRLMQEAVTLRSAA